MSVVIVCGSRFTKAGIELQLRASMVVCHVLDHLPEGTVIRHGGAPGVDAWADTQARQRPHLEDPDVMEAQWKKFGRSAGAIRNREMLTKHPRPEKVIAIWDGRSPGTADMIQAASAAGVPIDVIEVKGEG